MRYPSFCLFGLLWRKKRIVPDSFYAFVQRYVRIHFPPLRCMSHVRQVEPEYGIKAYKIRLLVSQIEFLDDKIEEFNSSAGCAGADQRALWISFRLSLPPKNDSLHHPPPKHRICIEPVVIRNIQNKIRRLRQTQPLILSPVLL